MSKQTKRFLISNAWEAEEMMLRVMSQQDKARHLRNDAAVKAANSTHPSQYDFYYQRVVEYDNQLVTLYRAADEIAEILPMPQ